MYRVIHCHLFLLNSLLLGNMVRHFEAGTWEFQYFVWRIRYICYLLYIKSILCLFNFYLLYIIKCDFPWSSSLTCYGRSKIVTSYFFLFFICWLVLITIFSKEKPHTRYHYNQFTKVTVRQIFWLPQKLMLIEFIRINFNLQNLVEEVLLDDLN